MHRSYMYREKYVMSTQSSCSLADIRLM